MANAERTMANAKDAYTALTAAFYAVNLQLVTGQPVKGLDAMIDKWVINQPEKIKDDLVNEINTGVVCAMAPRETARKCLRKLRELTDGAVFMDRNFLTGAERYAEGDYPGAAKAWRGYIARRDWHYPFMHDMLAIAFDGAKDPDNATRVDERYVAQGGRFNGAEPAHVREALRSEARGDLKRAVQLATKVVRQWSTADIDIPAVAEMRKLIARHPDIKLDVQAH
jgi:hypothetical protein